MLDDNAIGRVETAEIENDGKPTQDQWITICHVAMKLADSSDGTCRDRYQRFSNSIDEQLKGHGYIQAPRFVLVTAESVEGYDMWAFGSKGATAEFWERGAESQNRFLAMQL